MKIQILTNAGKVLDTIEDCDAADLCEVYGLERHHAPHLPKKIQAALAAEARAAAKDEAPDA